MLKIRLLKRGKRNAPTYRIVVAPSTAPRDGKVIEVLGYFNPSTKPPNLSLDKGRLAHWLNKGAKMTTAVEKISKGRYQFKPYHPKPVEKEETTAKEAKGGEKEVKKVPQSEEEAE